jgi:hypothetical protein
MTSRCPDPLTTFWTLTTPDGGRLSCGLWPGRGEAFEVRVLSSSGEPIMERPAASWLDVAAVVATIRKAFPGEWPCHEHVVMRPEIEVRPASASVTLRFAPGPPKDA